MTLKSKSFVEDLNNLIKEAVIDGGDAGGPYHSNSKKLRQAIENVLINLNLTEYYVSSVQNQETEWIIKEWNETDF